MTRLLIYLLSWIMAAHNSVLLLPKLLDVSPVTSESNLHVSFVTYLLFTHGIHRIDREAALQTNTLGSRRSTRCDCTFSRGKSRLVYHPGSHEGSQLIS